MFTSIVPGLWAADHDLRVGGLAFGTRTFLLALPGGLALVSPGPLDAAGFDAIEAKGVVRWIIAPNAEHHLFVAAAHTRFPAAEVWISPALTTKHPDWDFARVIPDDWQLPGLRGHRVAGGPSLEEVVLLHEASRTLILTDLCFNFHHHPSALFRWGMWLNGAWDRFGPSRLMKSILRDRPAARRSLDVVLAWPFDRIAVCHGDVLAEDGPRALAAAFSYLGPSTR
jgi:hypothetical protein